MRDAMPDVVMIPKESPVDHAANGEAETRSRGCQEASFCVEEQLGRDATTTCSGRSSNSHMVAAANCPTRYRIGDDGKTAERRRTGKRRLKPALESSENEFT